MRVLSALMRHPGRVRSRDELLTEVWEDRFVTDEVLTQSIAQLRRAFGDDPRSPEVIATVPGRGYRLLLEPRGEPPAIAARRHETPLSGIVRFVADRRAASYLGAADPSGRLRMPIIELHNSVDPVVPLPRHRDAYLALLGDGADLLRVREIDRFGHCAVTPDELIQAFDELVAWSSTATLED